MDKTKIEWADATWNPVTGCLHGCEYCYARRIAERFKPKGTFFGEQVQGFELKKPIESGSGKIEPYPFGFSPTLHGYKLDTPKRWTRPRTIFVCSMSDLFGEWVPDEWIEAVFSICKEAPYHRYLFLTKNPVRYMELAIAKKLPMDKNMWFGTSTPTPETQYFFSDAANVFVSVEPMLADFGDKFGGLMFPRWVIIGAETGNRHGKTMPRREWIETLTRTAEKHGAAVFMKDSLIPIVGEENMRQDFPWEKEVDDVG